MLRFLFAAIVTLTAQFGLAEGFPEPISQPEDLGVPSSRVEATEPTSIAFPGADFEAAVGRSLGFAAPAEDEQQGHVQQAAWQLAPAARPMSRTVGESGCYPTGGEPVMQASPTTKVGHLRQAVQHLEAAGMLVEASQMDKEADRIEALHVLKQKVRELKRLQSEIEGLRKVAEIDAPHIVIECVTIEADHQRLIASGISPQQLSELLAEAKPGDGHVRDCNESCAATQAGDGTDCPLEKWSGSDGLRVIARPRLRTVSGHAASVSIGNNVPVLLSTVDDSDCSPEGCTDTECSRQDRSTAVEFQRIGYELLVTPTMLDNGKIHLDARLGLSRPQGAAVKSGSPVCSGVASQRMAATGEVAVGETMVIAGPVQAAAAEDEACCSLDALPLFGGCANAVLKKLLGPAESFKPSQTFVLLRATVVDPADAGGFEPQRITQADAEASTSWR